MIYTTNEFESVKAFTHIAGCSLGTWTDRETTFEMIKVAETVSNHIDHKKYYKELAEIADENSAECSICNKK